MQLGKDRAGKGIPARSIFVYRRHPPRDGEAVVGAGSRRAKRTPSYAARVLRRIRNWLRRTFGRSRPLDPTTWDAALLRVRGTRRLSSDERSELPALVREFLHHKEFVAAGGFELTDHHRFTIAIQACIPILHLGLAAYSRFRSIYVFPGAFQERSDGEWQPGRHAGALAGLAIRGGGIALAWSETKRGFRDDEDSYNPVIHEFAHQLDMIDGATDGRPPLPPGVTQREWFETFSAAFTDFQARLRQGESTGLSDYAATNPAEFFAVLSEVYFEEPDLLAREYRDVLRLLHAFYQQRPLD